MQYGKRHLAVDREWRSEKANSNVYHIDHTSDAYCCCMWKSEQAARILRVRQVKSKRSGFVRACVLVPLFACCLHCFPWVKKTVIHTRTHQVKQYRRLHNNNSVVMSFVARQAPTAHGPQTSQGWRASNRGGKGNDMDDGFNMRELVNQRPSVQERPRAAVLCLYDSTERKYKYVGSAVVR